MITKVMIHRNHHPLGTRDPRFDFRHLNPVSIVPFGEVIFQVCETVDVAKAVEHERVVPVAEIEIAQRVPAVAGVDDVHVFAGFAPHHVVATTALQAVVIVIATKEVIAVRAQKPVGSVGAGDNSHDALQRLDAIKFSRTSSRDPVQAA
jgi:hypothetical protein